MEQIFGLCFRMKLCFVEHLQPDKSLIIICEANSNSNFPFAYPPSNSCAQLIYLRGLTTEVNELGTEDVLMFGEISSEVVVFFLPHQCDFAFLLVFITTQMQGSMEDHP